MAVEHFIQGRKQGEHHFGGHSKRMGLDASDAKIRAWREERIQAHLGGHTPEPLDSRLHPDQYQGDLPEEAVVFWRHGKTLRED